MTDPIAWADAFFALRGLIANPAAVQEGKLRSPSAPARPDREPRRFGSPAAKAGRRPPPTLFALPTSLPGLSGTGSRRLHLFRSMAWLLFRTAQRLTPAALF